MRPALTVAVLLAVASLVSPALAFDVQNGSSSDLGGSANLGEASSPQAGVDIDTDLRSQLGLPDDKTKGSTVSKSTGLQFGGGVISGPNSANTSSMGYDESPWVVPRKAPGRD